MPKKQRQATRNTPGFTGPFKGDPQQGTLFDARTLLNPAQHIGPRGYSPERLREIRDTGIGSRLMVHYQGAGNIDDRRPYDDRRPGATELAEAAQGYAPARHSVPEVGPDQFKYGPAYLGEKYNDPNTEIPSPSKTIDKAMKRPRAKLVEDLARSTVPAKDLQGISSISVRNKERTRDEKHGGFAGLYTPHQEGGKTTSGRITMVGDLEHQSYYDTDDPHTQSHRGPQDDDTTMTLLHEIGHHASFMANTEHSQYSTPSQQGREEASADTYALRHYREDRRGRNWSQPGSFDPREHTYGARDQAGKFGFTQNGHPAYQLNPHDQHVPDLSLHRRSVSPEEEERDRPQLPEMPREVGKGWSDTYSQRRVQTNMARNRPVREMQQSYIKARYDPKNRTGEVPPGSQLLPNGKRYFSPETTEFISKMKQRMQDEA